MASLVAGNESVAMAGVMADELGHMRADAGVGLEGDAWDGKHLLVERGGPEHEIRTRTVKKSVFGKVDTRYRILTAEKTSFRLRSPRSLSMQ